MESIHSLLKALDDGGVRAGLEYLNGRVPHRFTAVYALGDESLTQHELVDKLKEPIPGFLKVVPLKESFCQFTIKASEFVTRDSARDQRLDGQKYQGGVGSYVGLPLTVMPGGLFGTFCHYDLVPQDISFREFAYLKRAVRALPKHLHRFPKDIAPQHQGNTASERGSQSV